MVRVFIKFGAPCDIRNKTHCTALHFAASLTDIDILVEFVNTLQTYPTIDVNSRNKYGRTALHEACEHNNAYSVKILLKAGAEADIQDYEGMTPLYMAARFCSENVVDVLVNDGKANLTSEANNSPSQYGVEGKTPVHYAMAYQRSQPRGNITEVMLLHLNPKQYEGHIASFLDFALAVGAHKTECCQLVDIILDSVKSYFENYDIIVPVVMDHYRKGNVNPNKLPGELVKIITENNAASSIPHG